MLSIRWSDIDDLRRFAYAIAAIGPKKMPKIANRAVNRGGDMSRTQVRRALTKQTGLKRKTIVKAVRVKRSSPATLTYRMDAKGGDVSLKYFAARETRRGVSAKPFGERQVFPGTFMKGGRFPGRAPLNMGGQVFKRVGASRFPIEKQKSGVVIPAEMVKDETAQAFTSTVARVLPQRLEHEIGRATKGVIS